LLIKAIVHVTASGQLIPTATTVDRLSPRQYVVFSLNIADTYGTAALKRVPSPKRKTA
jgi:hypothetical protein